MNQPYERIEMLSTLFGNLNFENVNYIDSSGLGSLLKIKDYAQNKKAEVKIVKINVVAFAYDVSTKEIRCGNNLECW